MCILRDVVENHFVDAALGNTPTGGPPTIETGREGTRYFVRVDEVAPLFFFSRRAKIIVYILGWYVGAAFFIRMGL